MYPQKEIQIPTLHVVILVSNPEASTTLNEGNSKTSALIEKYLDL